MRLPCLPTNKACSFSLANSARLFNHSAIALHAFEPTGNSRSLSPLPVTRIMPFMLFFPSSTFNEDSSDKRKPDE